MFKKFGGTLHDGAQVNEIVPGDVVLLRTRGGATYKTNKLIIAAGPWSEKLIKPLGIDVPLKVYNSASTVDLSDQLLLI